MSVPRDAAVVFPSFKKYGVTKINSAYTLGGVAETAKTLDKYYRVPIDGYIEINMGGLKKLVQQIDGVNVTALSSFTNNGYTFKKGPKYHLNGDKALAYTQIRREDNRHDYGRQERIRQVMMAIIKSVKPSTLLNDKLMKLISKEVRTDFHINQMYRLAVNYRHATNNIVSDNVQGTSKLVHNKEFGDMVVEEISLKERQRASDLLRKNLNLPTVKLK